MSDGVPQQRDGRGRRLGSGYFLVAFAVAVGVLLWMRGFGRFLLPLLIVFAVVYGVRRFVKLVREPVE